MKEGGKHFLTLPLECIKCLTMVGNLPGLITSERKVVNLSSRKLTWDEIIVPHLGLRFIQKPLHKYIVLSPTQLLANIETTSEKYIWPKTMSAAQSSTMESLSTLRKNFNY